MDTTSRKEAGQERTAVQARREFAEALMARRIVARFVEKRAMEHDSPEALAKYLKEHPDADKSKHTVKKPEKKEKGKEEAGKDSGGHAEPPSSAIMSAGLSRPTFRDISHTRETMQGAEADTKKKIDKGLEDLYEMADPGDFIKEVADSYGAQDTKAEAQKKGLADIEKQLKKLYNDADYDVPAKTQKALKDAHKALEAVQQRADSLAGKLDGVVKKDPGAMKRVLESISDGDDADAKALLGAHSDFRKALAVINDTLSAHNK